MTWESSDQAKRAPRGLIRASFPSFRRLRGRRWLLCDRRRRDEGAAVATHQSVEPIVAGRVRSEQLVKWNPALARRRLARPMRSPSVRKS